MKTIADQIKENKIISIFREVDHPDAEDIFAVLWAAGIRLFEITFDQSQRISQEMTAGLITTLKRRYPESCVGAGTVLSIAQVDLAAAAGAEYIVAPNTDLKIIAYTKMKGLAVIPGAMTPTEVAAAHDAGADYVKLFPAGTLGPGYIKDITAPLNHVQLIATGGIHKGNLQEFLRLGLAGVGVGGALLDKELLARKDYEALTASVRDIVSLGKEY